METQRAADLAWLLAPTPSLSQLSFIFNDLIQFKSFRNTARFMFAIYNRETIIKKLILKTNKNRTTGPGPPTGQFSELCLSINVLTPGRGFVTIILNICDDNSNQMSGYWEGRGCSPGVHRIITLNNQKIYRSGSSKLMSDDTRIWTHRAADLPLSLQSYKWCLPTFFCHSTKLGSLKGWSL